MTILSNLAGHIKNQIQFYIFQGQHTSSTQQVLVYTYYKIFYIEQMNEHNQLSPLFVDTEFVPAKLHYLTLINPSTPIPNVLPYPSEDITFGQLEFQISRILPSFSSLNYITEESTSTLPVDSSIKEFKFRTGRRRIDGDEIITSEEGFDLTQELSRMSGQASERCDLCCIMLANKSDVIHLSFEWKSEQATRLKILQEVNQIYQVQLGKQDLQFHRLSFECRTEQGLTSIRYIPKAASSLQQIIFDSQGLAFVGINVISNRFSAADFIKKASHPQTSIPGNQEKIIQIVVSDIQTYRLEYEKIKQYQTREILGIFSVKDPESKGLKIMGQIYEPGRLLDDLYAVYNCGALINHVCAEVAEEYEVFLQGISKAPPLTPAQLRRLFEESSRLEKEGSSFIKESQKSQLKKEITPLSLFNSNCQIHSNKETSFKLLYHIIHRYIRNYFTHFNSFFDNSTSSRFVHGLQKQIIDLPVFVGETWRKVGYELNYQIGEIITLNNFIITSTSNQFLDKQGFVKQGGKETYLKVFSQTGRVVGNYTSFYKLSEVIFQPFTKFKVVQRLDDENIVYLTITQVVQPLKKSHTNIILWVDDKFLEGQEMFKQVKKNPTSIYLYQLVSTEGLNKWIDNHQNIINDKSNNIIMITNMRRTESGKQNPIAGIHSVILAKERIPQSKIIFYIGNIQNTKSNLIKNQINPNSLFITNSARGLLVKLRMYCEHPNLQNEEQDISKTQKQKLQSYLSEIQKSQHYVPFELVKEPQVPKPIYQMESKPKKPTLSSLVNKQKIQLLLASHKNKNNGLLPVIEKNKDTGAKHAEQKIENYIEKEKASLKKPKAQVQHNLTEQQLMQFQLSTALKLSKKLTDDVI